MIALVFSFSTRGSARRTAAAPQRALEVRLPLRLRSVRRNERTGAMAVLMACFLIAVLAMVAFSVDVGLTTLLRSEVQTAVDAGALAAAIQLQNEPDDIPTAENVAREFVQLNRAGAAVEIPEDAIDVEPGHFDHVTGVFTTTLETPNALRVFARQDNERFYFGRIFGHDFFGAPASAVAASSSVPIDVMLVLDLSGSMRDYGRIEALHNSAPAFVDVIESSSGDDRIGVMGLSCRPDYYPYMVMYLGYTGVAYNSGLHPTDDHHIGILESPLTTDFASLKQNVLGPANLPAEKYGYAPYIVGYTGTGAAIGDAAHYLNQQPEIRNELEVEKVIVLMSDGYANRPTHNAAGYALAMAEYAADRDISIYTISLGNEADLNLMNQIATTTGGEHFDATGSGEGELTEKLTDAFRQAASAIKNVQLVK